ncbi:tRNA uridine-5-carboxymethylaminomethyl(34) synthesis GTPase MnmE [Haematobacter massiliensis]|uniref:tRNA modification GTPase MnmE n=1 Tax=Haematobacter massiliensis TaxID=195105 RepID=A0A086Y0X2_9RHOB|nr:tRNA uridine-5-carboxymethylaminomethyl(34) synthesis GTPase MnmE [Haematobacter massiliensis]KFI27922.1 tRNA modification GTPase TrmE [Haematobacter massiliensis]OWJ69987.1 tRNA uridine-5-carboxymethylaminomethyl(34) synthesis GTPase MnmE [Haematobacter massiliensis]OWJ87128.1 tRNA uridine-5-carboxymethylaminomethyl(34) synthesis GTPase MnmE [Haematobacter massiliensis]QBJ25222.1 tRNA uridine-5-carboxymethylaminomethyl(34) synthesis GTPase MnmE [Haematobacter massiliensis]
MDTIYALATARGRAGVAVIRVSGPRAWDASAALAGVLPEPRHSALRRLTWEGDLIDEALVLVFDAGKSFTGERVVEFHLHGSIAVVSAVLSALGQQTGLRPAEAGEFTRRALENGRLDLSQVEGLADLIDAETEIQRKQAVKIFSGAISARMEAWRSQLVRAAALIEATIDFADEEVPVDVSPEVTHLLDKVISDIRDDLKGASASERIREGFEVAIVGVPNAGKSTLLNALAGREAAITSEVAGTTRDVIEVRMDLRGLPVTLLDTAGLRDTSDVVETIGIARAQSRAKAADLRVFLTDDDALPPGVDRAEDDIVVRGKADLRTGTGCAVSGLTGEGVDQLVDRITALLEKRAAGASLMVRERHREALRSAEQSLAAAVAEVDYGQAEIVAEHIRFATLRLESLVGRVDVEDLLGEIFSSFCIGK